MPLQAGSGAVGAPGLHFACCGGAHLCLTVRRAKGWCVGRLLCAPHKQLSPIVLQRFSTGFACGVGALICEIELAMVQAVCLMGAVNRRQRQKQPVLGSFDCASCRKLCSIIIRSGVSLSVSHACLMYQYGSALPRMTIMESHSSLCLGAYISLHAIVAPEKAQMRM